MTFEAMETLEKRLALSAVSFVPHSIIADDHVGLRAAVTGDFDGDLDLDIVAASHDGNIVVYDNVGAGRFDARVLTQELLGANLLMAADVDGDQDLDLLIGAYRPPVRDSLKDIFEIHLLENLGGTGEFSHRITLAGSTFVPQLVDFDGDLDLDIIDQGGWYENLGGAGGFEWQPIDPRLFGLFADLDGDGDADLVSGNRWFENIDASGKFGEPAEIPGIANFYSPWAAVDRDLDGDVDLLFGSRGNLHWLENTDGKGSFRVDEGRLGPATNVALGDVDGDGLVDIIAARSVRSRLELAWIPNSTTAFPSDHTVDSGSYPFRVLQVADIDGDSDLDILARKQNDLAWYENLDGNGAFSEAAYISHPSEFVQVTSVASDINADGELDLVVAASNGVSWYETDDGTLAANGIRHVISEDPADFLIVSDLSGDGLPDVIHGTRWSAVSWQENRNGHFGPKRRIHQWESNHTTLADMDGDGDSDILVNDGWGTLLYLNIDGNGSFSNEPRWVGDEISMAVGLADLNGDGPLDIVESAMSSGGGTEGVGWYPNDGNGNFERRKVVSEGEMWTSGYSPAGPPVMGDFDSDGDLDVLTQKDDHMVWIENADGLGSFDTAHVITSYQMPLVSLVFDIDADSDPDILLAGQYRYGYGPESGEVVWLENEDGRGTFSQPRTILRSGFEFIDIELLDHDEDGDDDLLVSVPQMRSVILFENRLTADADGDGQVGFADLLLLADNFGKDEVVWADGDFDGNGKVEFADFLMLASNYGRVRGFSSTN